MYRRVEVLNRYRELAGRMVDMIERLGGLRLETGLAVRVTVGFVVNRVMS